MSAAAPPASTTFMVLGDRQVEVDRHHDTSSDDSTPPPRRTALYEPLTSVVFAPGFAAVFRRTNRGLRVTIQDSREGKVLTFRVPHKHIPRFLGVMLRISPTLNGIFPRSFVIEEDCESSEDEDYSSPESSSPPLSPAPRSALDRREREHSENLTRDRSASPRRDGRYGGSPPPPMPDSRTISRNIRAFARKTLRLGLCVSSFGGGRFNLEGHEVDGNDGDDEDDEDSNEDGSYADTVRARYSVQDNSVRDGSVTTVEDHSDFEVLVIEDTPEFEEPANDSEEEVDAILLSDHDKSIPVELYEHIWRYDTQGKRVVRDVDCWVAEVAYAQGRIGWELLYEICKQRVDNIIDTAAKINGPEKATYVRQSVKNAFSNVVTTEESSN